MLLHYSRHYGVLRNLASYCTFYFNAPSTVLDEFTQILFMWMILLGGVYTAGLKNIWPLICWLKNFRLHLF